MYREVSFKSERNSCAGRLYVPEKKIRNGAAIVLAHGLSGTMDSRLFEYADYFRSLGFYALVFDYRFFGSSEGEPRQFLSVPKQKADWKAAIEMVRGLDDVDAHRVGLFGSSFSGGHVIHLALEDPEIRAVTAQCPLIDSYATMQLAVQYRSPKQAKQLQSLILLDWFRGLVGLPTITIKSALESPSDESLAVLASPEAHEFFNVGGPNWVNAIAARSFISGKLSTNDPSRLVDDLRTPTLLQICDKDLTVDNESIKTFARRAGPIAEVEHYDCGHFEIYLPPFFKKAVSDAGNFFERHLIG